MAFPALKSKLAILAVAAAAFAAAAAPAFARPIVPAEKRVGAWTGIVPACDDPGILSTVQYRFAQKEREFWSSSAAIAGFDRVRQTSFRPFGADLIPRRYCAARATLADGRRTAAFFVIGEDLGTIGWGPGVELCLPAYDHDYAYAPACRIVRAGHAPPPHDERAENERARY
ncbi:MAG: hypothetical protein KGI57_05020 [Hyphomicrobiales bacterium]|nr:hypothetical protein [Hyphomicrobiales bacterium]MDE2017049.1 hypothetical protein [Hyphomicrobiales bacterium]